MKKIVMGLMLAVTLFAASCKKETDAEILANRLQDIIRTEHIERVLYNYGSIGDPSNWTIYGTWGLNYSFNAPFVVVEDRTFNLLNLQSYQIVTISSYKCLVLIFRS